MGDDPHVPLSHGAHLLHVVGHADPLGGGQRPHRSAPTPHFLLRTRSAHAYHQPHLDAQEDNAAAKPRGLELLQQAGTDQRRHEGSF